MSIRSLLAAQQSGGVELLHTLDNPNAYGTSENDNFGQVVDITDAYCIGGAEVEDDAGGGASGKAYIFNSVTGALLHTLDNPNDYNTSANDRFGGAVSISGTYCVVAARAEDDAGGSNSGKAYIFDNATGALLHTLDNPSGYGTTSGDFFGIAVSISDTYCVVGAYSEDDAGGDGSGKAYIFNTVTGALLHTLDNPNAYDTSAIDYFGGAVATSDIYCVVGVNREGDAGGTDSGKAYIFSCVTGALLHTLDNPNAYNTSASDYFGYSVGISDAYCIVGANLEDDAGGTSSGKAYIFDNATGALLHTLDNPGAYGSNNSDNFGYSVSISDTHCIVGAYVEDDATGNSSGKAYIFNSVTGALLHTLDNPNPEGTGLSDRFGGSVAVSDSYFIAGAFNEDDATWGNAGKAYIYG